MPAHRRRMNDKYVDEIGSLAYYGARYYDNVLIGWTQGDPMYRFAPDAAWDDPRRGNLYMFTLNNPLSYIDPDGRDVAEKQKHPVYRVKYQDTSTAKNLAAARKSIVEAMNNLPTGRIAAIAKTKNGTVSVTDSKAKMTGKGRSSIVLYDSDDKKSTAAAKSVSTAHSNAIDRQAANPAAPGAGAVSGTVVAIDLRNVQDSIDQYIKDNPNATKADIAAASKKFAEDVVEHEVGHNIGLEHQKGSTTDLMNESFKFGEASERGFNSVDSNTLEQSMDNWLKVH
jgi:RHS repeat-associated protein